MTQVLASQYLDVALLIEAEFIKINLANIPGLNIKTEV